MDTKLYVANLIARGMLDVEGATEIKTYSCSVESRNGRDYIDEYELDNERLGPDKYDFELDYTTFEVSDILSYIAGDYNQDLADYNEARRKAVARVAELIEQVGPSMDELLTLANEYNIPANIKVGKYTNDFRLIDAVDWDSSSMYC